MNEQSIKKEFEKFLEDRGLTSGDFIKDIINNDLETFDELTKWTDGDFKYFNNLLHIAENIDVKDTGTTTRDVGDILEELVCFIFKKSYFFDVVKNVRTKTNEIDQVIRLSKRGMQALSRTNLSRDLLVIPEDTILGECKNYNQNIGVTWFGKFYAVLKNCNCNFGIIFSLKKATGNFDNWSDSYGLLRSITLLEKYRHDNDFYILDFGLSDFKRIGNGESIFDIIKAKMDSIKLGTDYDNLLNKYNTLLDEDSKLIIDSFDEVKKSI